MKTDLSEILLATRVYVNASNKEFSRFSQILMIA